MKRNFFNPALVKITSRRFPGASRFGSAAYKTDAPEAGADDAAARETLLRTIQERVDQSLETRATKEELQALALSQKESLKDLPLEALRSMADDKTGVMATLAKQGLEINRLQQSANKEVKALDIRSQVAAWQDKNKDNIAAIMQGQKVGLAPLEIRAAANPMTVGTVNPTGSQYIGRVEVEPGITPFLRASPTFWDYITKGRTGAPTYVWVNKTTTEGAAAFIAPGQYKPNISFSMDAHTSVAKKIADSAKATTELLQDIDGMTTFIEQELKYQLLIKLNSTLMTGVSSNTSPAGIQTLSVPYSSTAIHTLNPNYMDCIRAVVGQMRSGYLTGDITVFINSVDAANMDLSKAVNSGVYLLPPFTTNDGRKIGGATIVEDNNVPVGHFQAAFLRFYRILIYKDLSIAWGWENDDFTKNLVTAICEMRLHQFFNEAYTGAFVYDTFDHVKSLIDATPVTP